MPGDEAKGTTVTTANEKLPTLIGILVETSKGVDLIVAAIRHRSVDQACWDIPQGLLDAGTVVGATSTAFRGTSRHEVCVLVVVGRDR